MEDKRPGGLRVWTPLLFTLIMILGMTLGFRLRDTLRYKRDIQTSIIMRNDRLEQLIDLISERYVDTLDINGLYRDAVTGILSHLDPHTVYIAAEDLQGVNEDLEGSFFGIGVEFYIIRDTIQVTSVVENGPAQKAGIHTGDKFIRVEDSLIAGNGITSEGIIQLLRGRQHSDVLIQIRDGLTGKYRDIAVTRDAIPLYSLDAHILLDTLGTGYIKINRFSATTFDEFMSAIQNLQAQGMTRLILDLRQNPGGFLKPAAEIMDQFLDGDKLIVYTQGRKVREEKFQAEAPGVFENGKLAILVDERSASASEIIAGAVQDWDRGIIVGRRTFGKGLVQEQYSLGDGSALRLTTARYYTPSGRSIQRPFTEGKTAYEQEIMHRVSGHEMTHGTDSLQTDSAASYRTKGGRTVYGGGGITPDIHVPYDTTRLSSGLLTMVFSEELRNVLWDYFSAHQATLSAYKDIGSFDRAFNDTSALRRLYLESLNTFERKSAEQILSVPRHRTYFHLQAKAQLARILFRNNGYYKISTRGDRVVREALRHLQDSAYYEITRNRADSASR